MTKDDDDIQDYVRPWVGLTDEEMLMIYGQPHEGKKYSLGRMVEDKLKEKNKDVVLTGEMLLKAAQSSLSPEQYDHFEAMSKHQPDIYDRLAYAIGVQDE